MYVGYMVVEVYGDLYCRVSRLMGSVGYIGKRYDYVGIVSG